MYSRAELIYHVTPRLLFFMSKTKRRKVERWLRGREEFRKLRMTDCAIVSWGKSGRTWLRLMISRYYQLKYNLPEGKFLEFDNFYSENHEIPRLFFTHGNYLRDYTGNADNKSDFYGKKVVLLVRDPRDVAVSQYFQWKHRMRRGKLFLNDYPSRDSDISVFDFVAREEVGIRRIIEFFNGWANEMPRLRDIMVVRYEDMRANPDRVLKNIVDFIGTPGTKAQVKEAVAFAAYDNMKKLEEGKSFSSSGRRLLPGDKKNPDSFKVRRGKVGGYRDYFDEDQIAEIDRYVRDTLLPIAPCEDDRRDPDTEVATAGLQARSAR